MITAIKGEIDMGIRKRPIRVVRAIFTNSEKKRIVLAEFVLKEPLYLKPDEFLEIDTE